MRSPPLQVECSYPVPPIRLYEVLTDLDFLIARNERYGGVGTPTVEQTGDALVVTDAVSSARSRVGRSLRPAASAAASPLPGCERAESARSGRGGAAARGAAGCAAAPGRRRRGTKLVTLIRMMLNSAVNSSGCSCR